MHFLHLLYVSYTSENDLTLNLLYPTIWESSVSQLNYFGKLIQYVFWSNFNISSEFCVTIGTAPLFTKLSQFRKYNEEITNGMPKWKGGGKGYR